MLEVFLVKMFSNNRGAIFHWVIFGILVSLGLFFILTTNFSPDTAIKGEWHLNFLHDTVYEAEVDLLELDQNARNFGKSTALQLANNGGFVEDSECGKYEDNQLWNKQENWCLPNVKILVSKLYKQHFLPTTFTEIIFQENNIAGVSGKKTITSSEKYKQTYTYNYNFNVDINYNFDEYVVLEQEARALVNLCAGKENFKDCIEKRPRPTNLELCETISTKQVSFCVLGITKELKDLNYKFALDFS